MVPTAYWKLHERGRKFKKNLFQMKNTIKHFGVFITADALKNLVVGKDHGVSDEITPFYTPLPQ